MSLTLQLSSKYLVATMQSQRLTKMGKFGFCAGIRRIKVSLISLILSNRNLSPNITIIPQVGQYHDLLEQIGWPNVDLRRFKFSLEIEVHLLRPLIQKLVGRVYYLSEHLQMILNIIIDSIQTKSSLITSSRNFSMTTRRNSR